MMLQLIACQSSNSILNTMIFPFFILRVPLFIFDLESQVGDIAWAPYSSTVFACVTIDGKAHIFDIYMDKYSAICSQQIVPRRPFGQLNHIAFSTSSPVLIVGDNKYV